MPSRPTRHNLTRFGRYALWSAMGSAAPRLTIPKLQRFFPAVAITLVLCGCAARSAYRDGKELITQDKVEQGLTKFQEAMRLDPHELDYKSAYIQTRDRALNTFLEQADRLANRGKYAESDVLYQRVLGIDSENERAKTGLLASKQNQRHLQLLKEAEAAIAQKDLTSAQLRLHTILSENPNQPEALALRRSLADKAAATATPIESLLSAAYKKPISIEFKDVAIKQIFEVISRTSGLNFLFDKDVKTDQKTSIFLKNSTIESAVYFTLLTNQLEQQVLDANTILIYPNTPSKQKDYQEVIVKTFFLANAEAKTVANTIKTILKTRDVVVDEKLNMLILRDNPESIRVAEKLIALHDVPEPEVMLEVEILEVKRTRLLNLGIQWPDSLVLTPLPPIAGGTLTLRDLARNLNAGSTGATIGSLTANVRKEDSDANLLANPRIRVRNHEKAKIMIGDRLPNITSTATSTGFVSESITYVDVGLKLDVEPTVYLDNDVAIKVSLEVSNIVSQSQTKSGSQAYQIGNRTASTILRLKDGETQVLAGLINDEDRKSASKVPGLGDLPIVGKLFGSSNNNNEKTEIVLSITPHLIRNIQRPDAALSEFRAGTENSNHPRPDSAGSAPATAAPARVNTPGAPPRPDANANAGQNGNTPINGSNASTGGGSIIPPKNGSTPVTGNNPSGNITPVPIGTTTDNGANTGNTANPATDPNGTPATTPRPTQAHWQGPPKVAIGDTFALQLTLESDQAVTSLPMAVGFDSNVLQVVGVTEGSFLRQGGAQTNFTSRIDTNGQILITGTRSGNTGASNPGDVATINFRALTASEGTRIQLLTIAPTGQNGRSIAAQLPPPHILQVDR